MRARMYCNDSEVPLGKFVSRFAANVSAAVAASLRAPEPGRSIRFDLGPDSVGLAIDGADVPLGDNQGFAKTLVRGTLAGMIGELKGIRSGSFVRIEIEIDGVSPG